MRDDENNNRNARHMTGILIYRLSLRFTGYSLQTHIVRYFIADHQLILNQLQPLEKFRLIIITHDYVQSFAFVQTSLVRTGWLLLQAFFQTPALQSSLFPPLLLLHCAAKCQGVAGIAQLATGYYHRIESEEAESHHDDHHTAAKPVHSHLHLRISACKNNSPKRVVCSVHDAHVPLNIL